MTALEVDDLAVITGPLVGAIGNTPLEGLIQGEVVQIRKAGDEDGDVWVFGYESGNEQYIARSSLRTWDEICEDPDVIWGEVDL